MGPREGGEMSLGQRFCQSPKRLTRQLCAATYLHSVRIDKTEFVREMHLYGSNIVLYIAI